MLILDYHELPIIDIKASSVTIGNFDGVHLGHRKLITNTIESAKSRGLKSVVVTFTPHPAVFFRPDLAPPLIASTKNKMGFLSNTGIDALLTLSFDKELASLTPEEYIEQILINKLNAKAVWVGYDFTFGAERKGTPETLKREGAARGFEANVLEPFSVEGIIVSSTKIRELLHEGKVMGAAKLLGRPHFITGMVVEGRKVGTALGFPTINLSNISGMIPKTGVYCGVASIDGKDCAAAINIGFLPTFSESNLSVEAHLLDFNANIYGATVSLAFLQYIRNEIKFASPEELSRQIKDDVCTVKSQFDKYHSYQKE